MQIGRIFGVKIIFTESLLALLAAYFVLGMGDLALMAFAAVFLHEAGHGMAARLFSLPVESVLLFPLGGVAEIPACRNFTVGREILIALAGPMVNLCLALGIWLWGFWGVFPFSQLDFALKTNLLMGALNLIPGLPLDGGRILRAFLSNRLGYLGATRLLARSGECWAVVIFLFGIRQTAADWGNCYWLLAAVYFFYAARRVKELSFLNFIAFLGNRDQSPGVAEGLLITARGGIKVGEVLCRLGPGKRMLVLVTDAQGNFLGTLPERPLIRTALSGGLEKTLEEVLMEVSPGESRNLFPGC